MNRVPGAGGHTVPSPKFFPPIPLLIVQRDDGMFSLGWHDDAPGPFESRTLAAAVAARRTEGAAA